MASGKEPDKYAEFWISTNIHYFIPGVEHSGRYDNAISLSPAAFLIQVS
jgi:hypothetical protein